MGLDLENFDGNVPAEFLCPNCHCVVYEPMLAECSHVFCSKCFKKRSKRNKRCPACGQELSHSFTPVNIEWKNTYEALQINCTKGCGKVVRLGDLQKHLNKFCPLSFVPCRNTRCTRKVRRRDILVHLRHCDFRMVSCEGCGLETRYVNLRMHQIVHKCVRQRNLHAIVQNKRELDAEVKRHRLQLQEESFKRELEDRDAEKAKMLDAIARQNPGRAVSAPTSTRKTSAITASRHQLSMSAFSHFSQTAPVSPGPQKLISDTRILCANCNKLFIAQLNHKQACKWHRGVSKETLQAHRQGVCMGCTHTPPRGQKGLPDGIENDLKLYKITW